MKRQSTIKLKVPKTKKPSIDSNRRIASFKRQQQQKKYKIEIEMPSSQGTIANAMAWWNRQKSIVD
jgi:hypothetical protein